MLPFLKKQQEGAASLPADFVQRKSDETENYDGLEACMEDLFKAHTDAERAAAFRAAFQLLDSQPNEEAT